MYHANYGFQGIIAKSIKIEKTHLNLSFLTDENAQNIGIKGEATITFHPWFYPTKVIYLDCKSLNITAVSLQIGTSPPKAIDFTVAEGFLNITFEKPLTRDNTAELIIEYSKNFDDQLLYALQSKLMSPPQTFL